MQDQRIFHIFAIGWAPFLVRDLLSPIGVLGGFHFTHGLLGDSRRLPSIQKAFPELDFVALSKANNEPLPNPDYALLASLEGVGIPTIRSMVQGDRVLRNLPANESLGYATLLARRIGGSLTELHPDVVLGSFDSLHGALSLAVAKSLGVPWVALSFPVIPDNLTGFCRGVTPESLVPLLRPSDDNLKRQAEEVFLSVRSNHKKVLAWRAPASFEEKLRDFFIKGQNFARRIAKSKDMGIDRFIWPTASERLRDIIRRSINSLYLPTRQMISTPPESRFVFFPLQMQPESSIDTWAIYYQDQLALIRQIALAVPVDFKVVVKLHFSDPDNYSRSQLKQLLQIPGLLLAHPNTPGFAYLEKASLVIAIQGTASLEAALLGKPVLMFGDSPYLHFPRTERARHPDEVHQQICEMLARSPASDAMIIDAFATYMARYMPGRINDWSKPIEEEALANLTKCFQRLRQYLKEPGRRANWYSEPPFARPQPPKLASLSS
jgi:hypothetical protein